MLYIFDVLYLRNKGAFHSQFNYISFFVIESIFAVYALFFLCRLIPKNIRWLQFIGCNTLLYPLFQHQIIVVLLFLRNKYFADVSAYIVSIIMTILVVAILVLPIIFTNKYLPMLAGRFRVKTIL